MEREKKIGRKIEGVGWKKSRKLRERISWDDGEEKRREIDGEDWKKIKNFEENQEKKLGGTMEKKIGGELDEGEEYRLKKWRTLRKNKRKN